MKTAGQEACIETLLQRPSSSIPLLPTHAFDASLTPTITTLTPLSLRASVFLLNDDLENCHAIVQAHEGVSEMDLMHSILHRREKDFWNSKWWISQRTWSALSNVEMYGSGGRDVKVRAKKYVDRVEKWNRAGKGGASDQEEKELQEVQYYELSSIVQHARQ